MKNCAMYRHCRSVPALIEEMFAKIEAESRLVLSTPEILGTTRILIFGCGDSLSAGIATRQMFTSLCGIPTQVIPSMEAARYEASALREPAKRVLAIGISNSGTPSRVIEAMAAMRAHGARTLAITGSRTNPMATKAERVLALSVPAMEGESPGIRGYVVAQMALYLIAVRFSEVRGSVTMDQAGAYRQALRNSTVWLTSAYERTETVFETMAKQISQDGRMELLGSGGMRAAADFGAAKLVEATGMLAFGQDVEEFAHTSFFLRKPAHLPTVLFAPSMDPAYGRAREIALALQALARPSLVLTDGMEQPAGFLSVHDTPAPAFCAPLLYSCLIALLISMVEGESEDAYYRGHSGPWAEKDFPDIKHSEILTI